MKIIVSVYIAAISHREDQLKLIIYLSSQSLIKLDFIAIRFLLYDYYLRQTQMTNFMALFILMLTWRVNV